MERPRGVGVLYCIQYPAEDARPDRETISFYAALSILMEDTRVRTELERRARSIKETGFDEFELEDLASDQGFDIAEALGFKIDQTLVDPYDYG